MKHHAVKVYGDRHGDPGKKNCNKAAEGVTAVDFSKPLFFLTQIGEND